MAFRIVWTKGAIRRLQFIYDYYYYHVTETVADEVVSEIVKKADQLARFPLSGAIENTIEKYKGSYRYLVSTNYKIIYKLGKAKVSIIAVVDTRTDPMHK